MKKKILYAAVFLMSFAIADSALSEMVTFGGIFVIDRSHIYIKLIQIREKTSDEGKIQVNIILGMMGEAGWALRCEDKWDYEKVKKASNSIATYINKNNDIEILKMLSNAGLSGCKVTR